MNILTIKLVGLLAGGTVYEKGYEEPENWYENRVYAQYMLFGRIRVYRKRLFTEKVPMWAHIQRACFGQTDWKSSRPKLIDASIAGRVIKTIGIFK